MPPQLSMPPLTNLKSRIQADSNWESEFNQAIARASEIASKLPLVHVLGRSEPQRLDVRTVFSQSPPRIPLSQEIVDGRPVCGPGAAFVEEQLSVHCGLHNELKDGVIYCYAGRARPDYGEVAIAVFCDAEAEQDFEIGGFPFDTGAVLKPTNSAEQALEISSIDKNDIPGRRTFLKDSLSFVPWRTDFAAWLAAYFGHDLDQYWSGHPTRPDPENLYTLNPGTSFRADSTWEILLKKSVHISTCQALCASNQAIIEIRKLMMTALTDHLDFHDELLSIRDKDLNSLDHTNTESSTHCDQLNNWIRENVVAR